MSQQRKVFSFTWKEGIGYTPFYAAPEFFKVLYDVKKTINYK